MGAKKPKRSHHLSRGQGSFRWDEAKQTWRGRLEFGRDVSGKRRYVEVTSKSEDYAWAKLEHARTLYSKGGMDAYARSQLTVRDWVDRWLDRREHTVRPKTYRAEHSVLTKWVVPNLGSRKLCNITGDDIREIQVWQREAGNSTTHARYIQRVFQQVLRDARADGYVIDDTALLAKVAKKAPNPREALSVEQATRILKIAGAQPLGSRWVAALLQGMRQG